MRETTSKHPSSRVPSGCPARRRHAVDRLPTAPATYPARIPAEATTFRSDRTTSSPGRRRKAKKRARDVPTPLELLIAVDSSCMARGFASGRGEAAACRSAVRSVAETVGEKCGGIRPERNVRPRTIFPAKKTARPRQRIPGVGPSWNPPGLGGPYVRNQGKSCRRNVKKGVGNAFHAHAAKPDHVMPKRILPFPLSSCGCIRIIATEERKG